MKLPLTESTNCLSSDLLQALELVQARTRAGRLIWVLMQTWVPEQSCLQELMQTWIWEQAQKRDCLQELMQTWVWHRVQEQAQGQDCLQKLMETWVRDRAQDLVQVRDLVQVQEQVQVQVQEPVLKSKKDSQIVEPETHHFRQQYSAAKLADTVTTTLTSSLPPSVSTEYRNGMAATMCTECQEAYERGGVQEFCLTLAREAIGMLWLNGYYRIKAMIPKHPLWRKLFNLREVRGE
jgi:hypothetical protein